jgi:hypothetical protein
VQAVFVYPDMIAACDFLAKLQDLWLGGKSLVMFMNVRFANEDLINEAKSRGLIQPGKPLSLSAKELVCMTLRHAHSEMSRSAFETDLPAPDASSYYWIVSPGVDLLFHCGNWIPLLMDFNRVETHDAAPLETSTIDGSDYVSRNFGKADVYFVRDTNELLLISFTPEAALSGPRSNPMCRTRLLGRIRKINAAHAFLYNQVQPWFYKEQFCLPVRFSGGNSPEWKWRQVERRANAVVRKMQTGGSVFDRVLLACPRITHSLVQVVRAGWINRRTMLRRVIDTCKGDRAALRRILWRVRHDTAQIAGRTIRDPQPNGKH